ncbi:MAG: carbohydrate-binding family 9-like protein [Pyrinomonadaceae bacterium]
MTKGREAEKMRCHPCASSKLQTLRIAFLLTLILSVVSNGFGAGRSQMQKTVDTIEAQRAPNNLSVEDLNNPVWKKARPVRVTQYWSGEAAPASRRMEARVVWTDEALFVRFVYPQKEPLVVSATPQLDKKTLGLWDRDVCELFIAPNPNEVERYFEFEAAPTGEWVDLGIHWKPEGRETDWDYHSGMTVSTHVKKDTHTIIMRVPWSALGRTPKKDERWRINLFRCVGKDPQRGYLAWQPTHTPQPAFHVPQVFGWIEFKR